MPAEVIIGILNYGLILIFGLCLSVEIAGGCESRRQRRTVALLCVLLLLNVLSPFIGPTLKLNFYTCGASAVLGVPGVICLLAMRLIFQT